LLLDRVYPVIFIDAITVKVRDGQVSNRPVYVAIRVSVNGERASSGCGSAMAPKAPDSGSQC